MTQFRIVRKNGSYAVYVKWLFFWLDTGRSFVSVEEAEEAARRWVKIARENGKVVKELEG